MATTVNKAFLEFMSEVVNLDPAVTKIARVSRDNLLENISEFSEKDGFFNLCKSFNVHFGSFARKTKCRKLDDIDLMIGIAGSGAKYFENSWDNVSISVGDSDRAQVDCKNEFGNLSSTKVVNKFKKQLENVREYSRSEVKRSGEAVVLNLTSREWAFDVVPCFHTEEEADGRSYFLIPNGTGDWKKTDPTIDRDKIQQINQNKDGRVLELIRLAKRWNKTKNTFTIPSYLLEVLILEYCDEENGLSEWIDIRFRDLLLYIQKNISLPIQDPKQIQGDINTLSYYDKCKLEEKARTDYEKACEAIAYEINDEDHKKSINKWSEIFGGEFPTYG